VVVNVFWGLRWFLTPRFVALSVYGVNVSDVDDLTLCGSGQDPMASPVFWHRTCVSPLASFLAFPWALLLHAGGALTALALGPLQLSKSFRAANLGRFCFRPALELILYSSRQVDDTLWNGRHRVVGYCYTLAVVAGTIGAMFLIIRSASGIFATTAFLVLLTLWDASFCIALRAILNKRVEEHRKWMIRHYALTWAAVPFRFFPLLIHSFGVENHLSYGDELPYMDIITIYGQGHLACGIHTPIHYSLDEKRGRGGEGGG